MAMLAEVEVGDSESSPSFTIGSEASKRCLS